MPPDDKNRIEDLNRSMYSRNAPDTKTRRKMRFFGETTDVKTGWDRPEEPADEIPRQEYQEKEPMHFLTKVLIGSAIFCLIALGAGAYLFFNGANLISGDNIEIAISGPISIPGGTPVTFGVTVTNKNSVALREADLRVRFPAGATDPLDTTVALSDKREELGEIPPGGSVTKNVQAVIFGEQNLQKEITAVVTYGIAGSSSVFTKEQSYRIVINSSPVVLTVGAFDEITSGQPFDMKVTVKSNAENVLRDVLLAASYPFGYSFRSSSIEPSSSDKTVWSLGDIPPGGSRTITISGSLSGENTDTRSFHFMVGARNPFNPLVIGTPFMETLQEVTIQKPFVSLRINVNGDQGTGDYVAQFGRTLNVSLRWANNLPETLTNVAITAKLSGSAYDKTKVTSPDGFFRSSTDEVIWNQQTNNNLASLAAGDSGSLTMIVTPMDKGTPQNPMINPEVTITSKVTGNRTSSANVPGSTAEISRRVKISSNVSLSGRIARSIGAFPNTGPIPPRAEQQTTYTVIWTVDNTSSAVSNAVVTAALPPYVTWLGKTSPSTESVTYDKNSGTVTWNVGTVGTYTAGTSGRREAQFQVSLEPSVAQIGQSPALVNQATLTATDGWTSASLRSTQSFLTTNFSTDPSYRDGNGTVAR